MENIDEVRKNKIAEIEKEEFDKTVGRHFSLWDGSNIMLTEYIKENLNDPDSYEHIKTLHTVIKDKKIIKMRQKFRARNGFGGMGIYYCTAVQNIETGELTSIEINQ